MKAMRRMRGKHLKLACLRIAVPLVRLQPHRMRRAIRISKPGDGRRVNFNFSAGGFQRIRQRIGPEGGKAGETRVFRIFRHFNQLIVLPELGERRQGNLLRRPALGGNLVKRLQPLQIVFTLSEALPAARFPALAEIGEDLEIIARFIARRDHPLHRHQMLVTVIAGHRHIVAFK